MLLHCLVLGDSLSWRMFSVNVEETAMVTTLKEKVSNKHKQVCANDPAALELDFLKACALFMPIHRASG